MLLPVNMSASSFFEQIREDATGTIDDDGVTTFYQLTLSDVAPGDRRMWAHFLGLALLTSITAHYVAKECRWYTKLRHRYLQLGDVHQRTVFVRRIPRALRSSARVAAYFGTLYPNAVAGAVVVQRLRSLELLVEERRKALAALERCIMREHRSLARAAEQRARRNRGSALLNTSGARKHARLAPRGCGWLERWRAARFREAAKG